MATARLVFETSENLGARCAAHFAVGPVWTLAAGLDRVAITSDAGLTVWDLAGEVIWASKETREVAFLEFVGVELITVSDGVLSVWDASGERRSPFDLDFSSWLFALDPAARQLGAVDDEARAAVFDIDSGERVRSWDMQEDYDFGRRGPEVDGIVLRGGRLFAAVGKELTIWEDGELDHRGYRGGKHLSQWDHPEWTRVGSVITEVTSDERGMVSYDADTLELLRQQPVQAENARACGDKLFVWTDQFLASIDPREGTVHARQTDWRGHDDLTVTADGQFAISVALGGELCVQRVSDLKPLDEVPDRIWHNEAVTEVAVNASGTRVCVGRDVNDVVQIECVDLEAGTTSKLAPPTHATDTFRFIDDSRLLATTGRWTEPSAVTIWNLEETTQTQISTEGPIMRVGAGWVATTDGESTVVYYSVEGGALNEVSRCELPEGWMVSEVVSRRFISCEDDDGETRLYDSESKQSFVAPDGQLSGRVYVATVCDDNYDDWLTIWDVTTGKDIGVCEADDIDEVVVCTTPEAVFFSNYDGKIFHWAPDTDPLEMIDMGSSGTLSISNDERHLVFEGDHVLVFDTSAPGEPIAQVAPEFLGGSVAMDRGLIVCGGVFGMYAIYRLEP